MIVSDSAYGARAGIWLFAFVIFQFLASPTVADERGFLGMQVQGNSAKIAASLGLPDARGVLIRDITVDGPASVAGLMRGDVIVKMNDTVIDTYDRLVQLAESFRAGQKVSVQVLRHGKSETFEMALTPWPEQWLPKNEAYAAQPELGITFSTLTQKVRDRFNVRWSSQGIIVTVAAEGFQEITSLSRGDVVTQINQQPVWEPKQFLDAYADAKKNAKPGLLLLVERGDGFVFMLQPVSNGKDGANGMGTPVFKLPGFKE